MYLVEDSFRKLIRALKSDVCERVHVGVDGDYTEVPQLPAIVFDRFRMVQNNFFRTQQKEVEKDFTNYSFTKRNPPEFFDILLDAVIVTDKFVELLRHIEMLEVFHQNNRYIVYEDSERPGEEYEFAVKIETNVADSRWSSNMSGLKNTRFRLTIEAVRVYDRNIWEGKLVKQREFHVKDLKGIVTLDIFRPDEGG